MRKIDTHIIHCSDSPSDLDIGVEEIRLWHTQERGWNDIGYHFVIKRNGTLERGRKLKTIGAHCKGHNRHSIGTCLIGGFHGMNDFTKEQLETLKKLHLNLMDLFGSIHICGHRDFDTKKTCPGFDVQSWFLIEKMKGLNKCQSSNSSTGKKHTWVFWLCLLIMLVIFTLVMN